MKLLIIFIVLNVVNVILQTIKSLATIKCGKFMAALVNAIAYGLYTVVLVYTVCDLPLWIKTLVVALANLIGVFTVKALEEKGRKDKLWKVEATIPTDKAQQVHDIIKTAQIPHNLVECSGNYTIFNCYCATQAQSATLNNILKECGAKFFVSQSLDL